jgi:hypothetical protein
MRKASWFLLVALVPTLSLADLVKPCQPSPAAGYNHLTELNDQVTVLVDLPRVTVGSACLPIYGDWTDEGRDSWWHGLSANGFCMALGLYGGPTHEMCTLPLNAQPDQPSAVALVEFNGDGAHSIPAGSRDWPVLQRITCLKKRPPACSWCP